MPSVNVYLVFNGNCEDAFNFYRSVFGGDFQTVSRFGEMPPQEGMPTLSKEDANRLMHISLPISKETVLMGSDTMGDWAKSFVEGNNFSLSVGVDSKEEADRIFNGLSVGGVVKMPMEDTFWGAYFGMWTDRFGINWQVNFEISRDM